MCYDGVMKLDPDVCYQAVLARDIRFDGVFFVGVASTGIYCRTVCTARMPRRENCSFFPSAAAAEQAGFRPCLLCRPELAPGNARIDAAGRWAAAALSRIEDGSLAERSLQELSEEMGISDRHLRRVVKAEFGVSPVELAQTQRLLLAKRLLTDTDLPIIEVAMASGFSSLRRFDALIKTRYRLNPSEFRRMRESAVPRDTLVCEVAYRPPLDWEALRMFLSPRACRGVEAFEGNRYLRTVSWKNNRGWIAVEPAGRKPTLRIEVSGFLAPALMPVLARVKRLFDLASEPQKIASHLGPLAAAHPGLRVPGAFSGFEIALRAILGQQVSVPAATTLMGRLIGAFGEKLETPCARLTHLSPSADRLARASLEELTYLGITVRRSRSLQALARTVAAGKITLEPSGDPEKTMALLKGLPGIGDWAVHYIAMRALGWPDAFPHTDLGIRKALQQARPGEILRMAEAWRPWRAYAAMHLWKSLEVRS
jgi:AraC family transcriptional regulator of adaptative response / DNA-3-methyladenine glycosylase II